MNDDNLLMILLIAGILYWYSRQGRHNAETWEWTDYRGHKQVLTVGREVH